MMDLITRLRYRSSSDIYPTDTALGLMSEAADALVSAMQETEQLNAHCRDLSRQHHESLDEIERLKAKLDFANREPPHCPSCNCGSSEPQSGDQHG